MASKNLLTLCFGDAGGERGRLAAIRNREREDNARGQRLAGSDGGTVMADGAGLARLSRHHWSDLNGLGRIRWRPRLSGWPIRRGFPTDT